MESLWFNRPGSKAEERFLERVRNWKELARDLLLELYTLRQVIDSIDRRYFEGQQALFPKAAEVFEELVDYIVRLVDLYNRDLAEDLERLATMLPEGVFQESHDSFCLVLSNLDKLTEKPANHQVAYLVDMAKVEALDTIGESGKAVELLDRHV